MTTQIDEAKPKKLDLTSKNHPFADPSHARHAEHKAAVAAKRADKAPTGPASSLSQMLKAKAARPIKDIDPSDPKAHKALRDMFGGEFEHYEDEPRHVRVTDKEGVTHAAMHCRVTHSYTANDMGMHKDEFQDTSETHGATLIKHSKTGKITAMPRRSSMNENVDLDEAFADQGSSGTDKESKRIAAKLKAKNMTNKSTNAPKDKKVSPMMQKEYYEIGDTVTIIESQEFGKIIDILEDNRLVVDTSKVLSKTGGLVTVEAEDIAFYQTYRDELNGSLLEFNQYIDEITGGAEAAIEEAKEQEIVEDAIEEDEEFDVVGYLESFGDELCTEAIVKDLLTQTDMSIIEAREMAADFMSLVEGKEEDDDEDEKPSKGKKVNPFAKKDDKADDEDKDSDDEKDEDSDDEKDESEIDDADTHQDLTKGKGKDKK